MLTLNRSFLASLAGVALLCGTASPTLAAFDDASTPPKAPTPPAVPPPATPPAAAPGGAPAAPAAPPRLSQEELQKRRDSARELLRDRGTGQPGLSTTGGAVVQPPQAKVTEPATTESKAVRFEPAELDLGEMTADIAKTGTVKLVNITDKPVIVTRVVPSCGCTTAPAPKDPIPVGGSVDIPITLKPGPKQGVSLAKRVTFQIEGEPPVIYTIKGQVAEYVRIEPELLTSNLADPESGKVVLTSVDKTPFKILGVNPAIVTDYTNEAKTEHVVHVDWKKWEESGSGVKLAFSIDHPKLASASAMIKRPLPPRDPNTSGSPPERKAAEAKPPVDPTTSELLAAVRKGDVAAISAALGKGAKIDDPDRASGRNALHWAARDGNVAVIEALISSKASVNAEDRTGKTALTIAAEAGKVDAVKALVKAGADVNKRDKIQGSPLLWAAGLGNAATVKELLASKADVTVADVNGLTPLLWAAGIGESESVAALLAAGADPSARDRIDGDDALMRAMRSGKDETVVILLSKGAKLDARNDKGATALLLAAGNGSLAKLKAVIAAKADLNAKDNSGRGVMDYANNRIDAEKDAVLKYLAEVLKSSGTN